MDAYYYFKELKHRIDVQIRCIQTELAGCPPGKLSAERTAGNIYYRQIYYENGIRIRNSITRKPDLIQGLLRRYFLSEQLENLMSEQKSIEYALTNIRTFNADRVVDSIAGEFPELSKDILYAALKNKSEDDWANEPYEQLDYKSEEKRQINSRGLHVRSKSEVMITDKYYVYELPFHYEQIIRIGDIKLAPDFTIRRADGKIFYWEHEGLMSNPEYRERQWKKLRLYESVGIVPWDNLIITYDNEDGIIDSRIIESEIRNKLLL